MPQFDWEPICQFVNDPPILVDGRCGSCLQVPFQYGDDFVCPQCGTRWNSPGYAPVAYKDWSERDPDGLPIMDKRRRGLGIFR